MEFIDSGPVSQKQIQVWTREDPVLSRVLDYTLTGWPLDVREDVEEMAPYRLRQSELSVESDCLLWGGRVIVPQKGRAALLSQLHEGHFGVSRMKNFSRTYFWWPGLDKDVERIAAQCSACQQQRSAAPPVPLRPWEWPERPWRRLHLDYCGPVEGCMLLVIVDAHSKWMDVHKTKSCSAGATIEKLRESFACHGIPETVVTDNATCFVGSEFQEFCKRNGVRHVTSPPFSPHSNGLAEKAVHTLKLGLSRQGVGSLTTRIARFLFRYRIMPHSVTGKSPAEMLFGRRMRTQLDHLKHNTLRDSIETYQMKQKLQYDQRASSRSFQVGDSVYMYVLPSPSSGSKWVPGVVTQADQSSCFVTLEDGRSFRRHFDHVRLRPTDVSVENSALAPVPAASTSTPVLPSLPVSTTPAPPSLESPPRENPTQGSQAAIPSFPTPKTASPVATPSAVGSPKVPAPLRRSVRDRRPPIRYGDPLV